MASPQSTTSHEDQSKKNLEQITFRFCAECSNMLYPKEDEDNHKLQFTCRTCQYTEEASSTCVFRNVLNNAAGETAGVTQDVGSDPTVGVASSDADTTVPPASAPAPFCVSHTSSTISGFPIMCLCCGKLVACQTCGLQVYAPYPATTTNESEFTDDDMSDSDASEPVTPTISLMEIDDMFDFDDLYYMNDGADDIFGDSAEYSGENLLVSYTQADCKSN